MSNRSKRFTFYWIVVLLAGSAGGSWGFSHKPPEPDYIPGRVVMTLVEGVCPERAAAIIEGERCSVERALKRTG